MTICALPLLRDAAAEVKLPPESVTVPVGVGLPEVALTVIISGSDCALVMVEELGDSVTVGVVLLTGFTVTDPVPDALL
jgi:hypothetical protein